MKYNWIILTTVGIHNYFDNKEKITKDIFGNVKYFYDLYVKIMI